MCKQPSSKWMQNAQTVAWQAPQPTTEGREQPVILSIHAAVSASQRAAAAFGDVDQDGDFDLLLGDSYPRDAYSATDAGSHSCAALPQIQE